MYQEQDLQQNRKRQIDTLKIFNDNVSEVIEDSEYKIEFTSGPNKLNLIIQLTPDFPLQKPILKIVPSINHIWTNQIGDEIISAPGLLNFTIHSDLGRVVQAVIRDLQLRPPTIIGASEFNNPADHASSLSAPATHISSYHIPSQPVQPQTTPCTFLPELNNLSLSELHQLNENDSYLEAFVNNLPCIQHLNDELDSVVSANQLLANENLKKEEKLKELSKQIEEKVEVLTQYQERHILKSHQYDQMIEKYNPTNIKSLLKASSTIRDEESEKIADDFLNKQIDLDMFLSHFIEKRMIFHRMRVKEERLSYQLEALQKAGNY